jgi:PPOX class probable F420-dependent enzyme
MTTQTLPEPALLPHLRAFLEAPRVASIATTGADGQPHIAVAWYRLEPDDRILLNSRSPRRWPADLLRDPRLAIAVIDEEDDGRWVGLTGLVETVIDDVEVARADIVALAHRYDGPDADVADFLTQARITFRVRIVRVHDHLDE